jgi:probable HAF family extracellular repeat protein
MVAAGVALSLAGCGGDSNNYGPAVVRLDIRWPERAASASSVVSAPSSALSVRIALSAEGAEPLSFTVDRPAGSAEVLQPVNSPSPFPTGRCRLECTFFAQPGAAGDIVGTALADVVIWPDGTGAGTIATEGQVASVEVLPDQVVTVGELSDLAVSVHNRRAELIAVSPGSVFWAVTEGPTVLTFEQGRAKGLVRGQAMVQATVDGVASAPAQVLSRRTPSAFLLPKWNPGGAVTPTAISDDGQVIVGVAVNAEGTEEAFRWTEQGGLAHLGFVEGYEVLSAAVAVSGDGSVIVGLSANTQGRATACVWTAAGGVRTIPVPPETVGSQAVDVSSDGQTVFGTFSYPGDTGLLAQMFTWSESAGFKPVHASGNSEEWDGIGMSGDGYRFVANATPSDPSETFQGAQLYEYSGLGGWGLWGGHGLTPVGSSEFFFGWTGAVSRTGTVVGGWCTPQGGGWVTPAIWSEATGVLQVAPSVVARVKAVSPDGRLLGGGNSDTGTAFLWDAVNGHRNLIVNIVRMDSQLGTHVESAFHVSGGPSNVTAISADNARIVGTAGEAIFGSPCYGFVLDLP